MELLNLLEFRTRHRGTRSHFFLFLFNWHARRAHLIYLNWFIIIGVTEFDRVQQKKKNIRNFCLRSKHKTDLRLDALDSSIKLWLNAITLFHVVNTIYCLQFSIYNIEFHPKRKLHVTAYQMYAKWLMHVIVQTSSFHWAYFDVRTLSADQPNNECVDERREMKNNNQSLFSHSTNSKWTNATHSLSLSLFLRLVSGANAHTRVLLIPVIMIIQLWTDQKKEQKTNEKKHRMYSRCCCRYAPTIYMLQWHVRWIKWSVNVYWINPVKRSLSMAIAATFLSTSQRRDVQIKRK